MPIYGISAQTGPKFTSLGPKMPLNMLTIYWSVDITLLFDFIIRISDFFSGGFPAGKIRLIG